MVKSVVLVGEGALTSKALHTVTTQTPIKKHNMALILAAAVVWITIRSELPPPENNQSFFSTDWASSAPTPPPAAPILVTRRKFWATPPFWKLNVVPEIGPLMPYIPFVRADGNRSVTLVAVWKLLKQKAMPIFRPLPQIGVHSVALPETLPLPVA
jgi:hypothetical protein